MFLKRGQNYGEPDYGEPGPCQAQEADSSSLALLGMTKTTCASRNDKINGELTDLRPALLGRNRFAGNFPGALRPIDRRFIVVLQAVVVVGVAHGSQRLVVKAR